MRRQSILLKLYLALCAVLLCTLPAPAQGPSEQAGQRLERLKERLQLTPEQVERVRPILLDQVQKMKETRDRYSGDQSRRGRLRMAREMKSIRNATDGQLKTILSKQQMEELKKLREEAREQRRERRTGVQ